MMMHEGGHIAELSHEIVRAVLDWLERYLGTVTERR
jgi:hypothetical protein